MSSCGQAAMAAMGFPKEQEYIMNFDDEEEEPANAPKSVDLMGRLIGTSSTEDASP